MSTSKSINGVKSDVNCEKMWSECMISFLLVIARSSTYDFRVTLGRPVKLVIQCIVFTHLCWIFLLHG